VGKSLGERREGCQAGTANKLRPLALAKVTPCLLNALNRKMTGRSELRV
jgi:hypothetical protein